MGALLKDNNGSIFKKKNRPTKRALDAGDSAAIPSIFLRLFIFPIGRRSAARPSASNANRWAARTKSEKESYTSNNSYSK